MLHIRILLILSALVIAGGYSTVSSASRSHAKLQDRAGICGQMSPLLRTLGDHYYDIETQPMSVVKNPEHGLLVRTHLEHNYPFDSRQASKAESAREADGVSKILKVLQRGRFKSGTGTRTRCFGAGDHLEARTASIVLTHIDTQLRTALVDHDSLPAQPVYQLTVYEHEPSDRRLRKEIVDIPVGPETDLHTLNNALTVDTRHRQSTLSGSNLRENNLHVSYSDNVLTIEKIMYVNGYLAEKSIWKLFP